MYRISKFDELVHRALQSVSQRAPRPDVKTYLSLKQATIDKYQKKILKHHKRLNKKINAANLLRDLETLRPQNVAG